MRGPSADRRCPEPRRVALDGRSDSLDLHEIVDIDEREDREHGDPLPARARPPRERARRSHAA